jgi:tetratricopeptide (TPR) repeat protein
VVSRSPVADPTRRELNEYLDGWKAINLLVSQGRSWSGNEKNCVYLNCGGSRFANVSAATGLDFDDDGRALGLVDWDHDGDLDVWLRNRTGPRLRLMLNESDGAHASLSVRLRGTSANRDGIGARVEVWLEGEDVPLKRTLYAGQGFLSQSSKWLHFGLGVEPRIARVSVRWPAGEREEFSGVAPAGRVLLVQGTGRCEEVSARAAKLALVPAEQPAAATTDAARIFLPFRLPAPILPYTDYDGGLTRRVQPDGPLLVNLWASWCAPCVVELEEFGLREAELRAAGVDLLTLTVDGMALDMETDPADARRKLEELGYPFPGAVATPDLLAKLELLQQFLFQRFPNFSVPTSFLLDGEGNLAVIYRGSVSVDTLLEDVRLLDASPRERQDHSVPFPGRWNNLFIDPPLALVAEHFQEDYPEDTIRYLEALQSRGGGGAKAHLQLAQAHVRGGRIEDAIGEYVLALESDPRSADALINLGNLLVSRGRMDEGLARLEVAVEVADDMAEAHFGLGTALLRQGAVERGVACLRRAVELDGGYAQAHHDLGVQLGKQADYVGAAQHFEAALDARPAFTEAVLNLANMLRVLGRGEDAIERYSEGLAQRPGEWRAHFSLGDLLAGMGRNAQALEALDACLALAGDFIPARTRRAGVLNALGRVEESLEELGRVVALSPDDHRVHSNRGFMLTSLGRAEEGLAACDRALALQGEYAFAHSNRAGALLALDRHSEALAAAERALALVASNAYAQVYRAVALDALNRGAEAEAAFAAALAIQSDLALGWFERGRARSRRGAAQEARADLERALQLGLPANLRREAGALLESLK